MQNVSDFAGLGRIWQRIIDVLLLKIIVLDME
jgi:hypothetical protein